MGGLARDLIYKVQLYASILSKSLCAASVQPGPQLLSTIVTGQWGGFWIQNISTLGCMAGCARWPCGEWVWTSNLNSSNILCSWNPIYQPQSDLTSYCHAHYIEVYQASQKPFLKQYFWKYQFVLINHTIFIKQKGSIVWLLAISY
jgi:hypothetical protein